MNPNMEVSGMGFARLVWAPSIRWSVSLIANTDEGHQKSDAGKFHKSYAVKIDYTGNEEYTGVILSHKKNKIDGIGAFGGWTATDAMLIYADIGFSKGNDILYPVEDNMSPFELSMQTVDNDSSEWNGTLLTGASYTFMAGSTFSLEYLYNSAGYTDKQAAEYYKLRKNAGNAYIESDSLGGISRMVLGQTANPGMRFFRKNYMVFQYRQNYIHDSMSLSLSWIYNVDDKGGKLVSILDYTIGDHVRLFSIGYLNTGGSDTEFRNVLNSSLTIGLEYTF